MILAGKNRATDNGFFPLTPIVTLHPRGIPTMLPGPHYLYGVMAGFHSVYASGPEAFLECYLRPVFIPYMVSWSVRCAKLGMPWSFIF